MTAKTEAKKLAGEALRGLNRLGSYIANNLNGIKTGHDKARFDRDTSAIIQGIRAALTSPAAPRTEGLTLAQSILEYARDLRRNSSGGDDYPWEYAKGAADYLEELLKRAGLEVDPAERNIRDLSALYTSPPPAADAAGLRTALDTVVQFEFCDGPEPTLRSLIFGYYMQGISDPKQAKAYAEKYIAALTAASPSSALAAAPSPDPAAANQFQSSDGPGSPVEDNPDDPTAKRLQQGLATPNTHGTASVMARGEMRDVGNVAKPEKHPASAPHASPGPSEAITDPAEVRRAARKERTGMDVEEAQTLDDAVAAEARRDAIEECIDACNKAGAFFLEFSAQRAAINMAITFIRALAPEGKP